MGIIIYENKLGYQVPKTVAPCQSLCGPIAEVYCVKTGCFYCYRQILFPVEICKDLFSSNQWLETVFNNRLIGNVVSNFKKFIQKPMVHIHNGILLSH